MNINQDDQQPAIGYLSDVVSLWAVAQHLVRLISLQGDPRLAPAAPCG
jgi:hypothetical protein